MTRSLLDLPPRLRPLFFCGYLIVQIGLLLRAQTIPDFVFGFQMFNASSELKIALFRKVRQRGHVRLVPVRNGAWQVKDPSGQLVTYRWQDRVRDGVLSNLDRSVHASYGVDAQLYRLRFALSDVLSQLASDHETIALLALVETRKNGRAPEQIRIEVGRP